MLQLVLLVQKNISIGTVVILQSIEQLSSTYIRGIAISSKASQLEIEMLVKSNSLIIELVPLIYALSEPKVHTLISLDIAIVMSRFGIALMNNNA